MKTKPLKTTQAQVLESCLIDTDTGDLILEGYEKANEQFLRYNSQNLKLDENNTFHSYFSDDPCCFYYQLLHIDGSKTLFSEMEKKFVSLNIACSAIENTLKLKKLISDSHIKKTIPSISPGINKNQPTFLYRFENK